MFENLILSLGFLLLWCVPIWVIISFFFKKKRDKPSEIGDAFDRALGGLGGWLADIIDKFPGPVQVIIYLSFFYLVFTGAICMFSFTTICFTPWSSIGLSGWLN